MEKRPFRHTSALRREDKVLLRARTAGGTLTHAAVVEMNERTFGHHYHTPRASLCGRQVRVETAPYTRLTSASIQSCVTCANKAARDYVTVAPDDLREVITV
jgi:hypothetical protein